ncbi:MAG: response regulator [Hymenobacter sp.]|nr:MAG: response regulator [Hymenobacter sp.]
MAALSWKARWAWALRLKCFSMKAFELVYIVEDDLITSKINKLLLKQHAAFGTVQQYLNGQTAFEALQAVAQHGQPVPNLILLDLNMPVMDGWEFLDAFGALHLAGRVCICVLTSSIDPGDLEKSHAYEDVKGFFTKPLDGETLDQMATLAA